MFDAIFTVAVYAAIAMGLLWAVLMIGAVVLAVVDHVREEVWGYDETVGRNEVGPLDWQHPVDDSPWEDWDFPVPEDNDSWNFPERKAS